MQARVRHANATQSIDIEGVETLEVVGRKTRTGASARALQRSCHFCEHGKNENARLRHFYDGSQVNLRFGTGGSILVADQPNRNPESIDFFSYLDHFLLF
jgi:hypothetical protein